MTREEALKTETIWNVSIFELESHINKIYDDFESRVCGNCKYYEQYDSVCCNGESPLCVEVVETSFGCNKFERRE